MPSVKPEPRGQKLSDTTGLKRLDAGIVQSLGQRSIEATTADFGDSGRLYFYGPLCNTLGDSTLKDTGSFRKLLSDFKQPRRSAALMMIHRIGILWGMSSADPLADVVLVHYRKSSPYLPSALELEGYSPNVITRIPNPTHVSVGPQKLEFQIEYPLMRFLPE